MAKKSVEVKSAGKPAEGGSAVGFILMLVVLTILSAGGGFALGTTLLEAMRVTGAGGTAGGGDAASPDAGPETGEGSSHDAGEHGQAAVEKSGLGSKTAMELMQLAPIVTNLREPEGTFIRIEGSLLMERGIENASVLARQISEDLIAFLRTASIAQIEGASGFQHLREDLNDRIRLRSQGKVRELIIQSLVVE